MKTLFRNGILITKDRNDNVINPGWLIINNNIIEELGYGDYSTHNFVKNSFDKIVDLEGKIMLPELINSHTHFSQSLLKVFSENMTLQDWLEKLIRPFQNNITTEQMKLASQLSIAENLRCGITTVVQHQKLYKPEYVNVSLETANEYGIRMALMLGCNDKVADYYNGLNKFIDYVLRIKDMWNNNYFSIGFGPTSLKNCSKEFLLAITDISVENKMPVHIHIAETMSERNESIYKNGTPPIRWLYNIGVLNENTQLVHCIWVDGNEINLIKNSCSHVIHCPINNLFLNSGYANIDAMLNCGIPVVIGTDGSALGVSQDIFSNLKLLSLLVSSSRKKPKSFSASYSLYMATSWAARGASG